MSRPEGYRLPEVQANPEGRYSEMFREYMPRQSEHILRLIMEQLQLGLRKDSPVRLLPAEIEQLALAMSHAYQVWADLNPE